MDATFQVKEHSTARYTAVIKDEMGAAVAAASLATLTLTLYDKASGDILNDRNGQDVLNDNGVTVDENGALVWVLEPDDNVIVDTEKRYEDHVALFLFTYDAGAKSGSWEIQLTVTNLQKVVLA